MSARALTLSAVSLCTALASAAAQAAATAAPPAGIRGEVLGHLDFTARRFEQLAQAIPQDKFTWRPAAGVRSVSEVLTHVGSANYFILSFAGVQPPTAPSDTSVTDKAQVIEQLRRGFDYARAAVRAMPDADLKKATTMFGRTTTYEGVLLTTATHAHEHLGQLIAYARMNGVTPPWSMAGSQ